jgi:hypothetical protein
MFSSPGRSAFFRQLQGFLAFLNDIPRWFSYLFELEAGALCTRFGLLKKRVSAFKKGH